MTELTIEAYYDDDTDRSQIDDKIVAVIGYGSQGHAHAQNLADNGVDVVVGPRANSSSRSATEADGLHVKEPAVAAVEDDIVSVFVPDAIQPAVFEEIRDSLNAGDTLQFAYGFNIHYNQTRPPEDVDVTIVAPKSPGHLIRRNYESNGGMPGLIAVHQDVTSDTKGKALAYAHSLGCTRAGVIETTFQEETETDLFGERVVLCGGVTLLVKQGCETLIDAGYSPEMAYFECLNKLKLIVDLMYEDGLGGTWHSVSDTAEFDGLTRGDRVIDEHARENMEEILKEVQDGILACKWILENQAGRPSYSQLKDAEENHHIEQVGAPLRGLSTWANGEDEADAEKAEAPADD